MNNTEITIETEHGFEDILAEWHREIESWKTDYAVTRATYIMARNLRKSFPCGSPEWLQYDRIETLAFNMLGIILDNRPE